MNSPNPLLFSPDAIATQTHANALRRRLWRIRREIHRLALYHEYVARRGEIYNPKEWEALTRLVLDQMQQILDHLPQRPDSAKEAEQSVGPP